MKAPRFSAVYGLNLNENIAAKKYLIKTLAIYT
jgi:hypothetical protein